MSANFLSCLVISTAFLSEIVFGLSANNADAMATLKLHNDLRSKVAKGLEKAGKNQGKAGGQPSATNMQEMIWDAKLANTAQNWANHLAATNKFEHNKNAGAGENIAYGTGSMSCKRATQMWYDEVIKGNCKTCGPYNYRPLNWNGGDYYFGHYTQVVWDNTYKLGCGWKKSATREYCVCNYSPGGNYGGQFPYEQGATASKCPAGTSKKNNGLCGRGGSNPAPTPKPPSPTPKPTARQTPRPTTKQTPKPTAKQTPRPTTKRTPRPTSSQGGDSQICIQHPGFDHRIEGTYRKTATNTWVLDSTYKVAVCNGYPTYFCLYQGTGFVSYCPKTASIAQCKLVRGFVLTVGKCGTGAHKIYDINTEDGESKILFDWKFEYKDIFVAIPFIIIGWCCCILSYLLYKHKLSNKKHKYASIGIESTTDGDTTASEVNA